MRGSTEDEWRSRPGCRFSSGLWGDGDTPRRFRDCLCGCAGAAVAVAVAVGVGTGSMVDVAVLTGAGVAVSFWGDLRISVAFAATANAVLVNGLGRLASLVVWWCWRLCQGEAVGETACVSAW